MIGDGVNDVPALKRARMAVAMGSGSQITKGIADIVLLKDQFSMLPRAVAEGRRIARNIHRLGRLYVTKIDLRGRLILVVAVPGWAFPFLPRQLTVAAFITIGIPSFVLALAPSDGPLYSGRLLRALAAFAVPAGAGDAPRPRWRASSWSTRSSGGRSRRGERRRPPPWWCSASASSCCWNAAPGASTSPSRATCSRWSQRSARSTPLILAVQPVRDFFDLERLGGGQLFLALLSAAAGLVLASVVWRIPAIEQPEDRPPPPDDAPTGPLTEPRRTAPRPAGRGARRSGESRGRRSGQARGPPHQDRRHRRAGQRSPEMLRELITPASTSSGSTSRTAPATNTPRTSRRIRAVGEEVGQARSGSSATCPGPKLRLGDLEGDVAVLHSGSQGDRGETDGDAAAAELPPGPVGRFRRGGEGGRSGLPGRRADPSAGARVEGGEVRCEVEAGGARQLPPGRQPAGRGRGLPAAGRDGPAPGSISRCEHGIDLLAVSFVRRADDLETVERRVAERGSDIPLIAKIEKPQAAERAEEIIEAATAGSWSPAATSAIELPIEEVPGVQKRLIALAGGRRSPSITATQMLASMVARAAADPGRGHRRRQRDLRRDRRGDALRGDRDRRVPGGGGPGDGPDRAGDRAATCPTATGLQPGRGGRARRRRDRRPGRRGAAYRLGLAAIVVPDLAAGAPRDSISAHRPRVPVLAVSPRLETVRRMNLLFGVQLGQRRGLDRLRELLDDCATLAREQGDRRVRAT